jgi:hypothetical protein
VFDVKIELELLNMGCVSPAVLAVVSSLSTVLPAPSILPSKDRYLRPLLVRCRMLLVLAKHTYLGTVFRYPGNVSPTIFACTDTTCSRSSRFQTRH